MAICHLAVALSCHLANICAMTNRIREVRKSKHMTLEELSDASGISTSFLSRIEKGGDVKDGRGLSLENAVKIARALATEVMDITDDFSEDDIEVASRLPLSDRQSATTGDIANLTIHAGLGNGGLEHIEGAQGGFVPPEFTDGFWSFPESVRSGFKVIGKTHALPVIGDSMAPTLTGGSIVFVDTTHTLPSPPDVYAVDYGDGLMVKRLELVPKSAKIRVISDNERYETHTLLREDVQVFGRVVASFQWRG